MKMKIADKPDDARADCGHERVQGRQDEPARHRARDQQEVAVHRAAIAQVAQQHDDEDSRERQLQADAEDVHVSPLSGVDRTGGRARVTFSGTLQGALLRAPSGAQ